MWPKLLDFTHDECRGMLRRLELESYSNIVGAFRAQGTLNANKMKILKDLREALHISDARHKAEVRRVVNDESLSTIAKNVCGPNSEIEWNKEGSRGHAILNRNTSHTALSVAANHASAYGAELNLKLVEPADTMRNSVLSVENDNSEVKALITEDPQMLLRRLNTTYDAHARHSEHNKHNTSKSYSQNTTTNSNSSKHSPDDRLQSPTPGDDKSNDKTQAIKLRRKSTTTQPEIPPKAILLTNRRAVKIDANVIPEPSADSMAPLAATIDFDTSQPTAVDMLANSELMSTSEQVNPHELKTIRTSVATTASTIPTSTNGIGQGSAQILKLIDGNTIVMRPSTSTQMVSTKPIITSAKSPANVYVSKTASTQQPYVTVKASNIEYVTLVNNVRQPTIKAHKIQTISPETALTINTNAKVLSSPSNHIISIPASTTATASAVIRNQHMLASSEVHKIIHTVSPVFTDTRPLKKSTMPDKYPPKYMTEAGTPIHIKPKTVTIHPGTSYTRAIQQTQPKRIVQPKIIYEEYNDWQDYDPNVVDSTNGYGESSSNGHYYQSSSSNDIYTDDGIITEEYITSEGDLDNVIEMDVDSPGYIADDIIVVGSPH